MTIWMRHFQLIGLSILVLVFLSDFSAAAEKNVLYINSYHAEFGWSQRIMNGMQDAFLKAPFNVNLDTEHLDTKRYPGKKIRNKTYDLISEKLFNKKFDLVIASDNNAFDFLLSRREKLFPNLPVVFCGVNNFHSGMIEGEKDITGIAETPSISETIRTALQLHPKTEEIIVIGSTSTISERTNLTMIEEASLDLSNRVLFKSWYDFSAQELEQVLPDATGNKLILLTGIIQDKSGNPLSFSERTSFVRRFSKIPIYSFWEHNLGHGIVGGKLISSEDQGRLAASMAVSILSGKNADTMEILYEAPNRFMFDFNEMERFGIGVADLPEGSKVINRPPTFIQFIRSNALQLIIFLLATIVVITIWRFITVKKFNRRIMHNNRELQNSERKLADIIDFLPDPTWVIDINGRVIAWNRAMERITGINKTEMIGKGNYEYAIPFYGKARPLLIDLILNRDEHWEKKYMTLDDKGGLLVERGSFFPELGVGGRYLSGTAGRLFNAHGEVVGAIETVRDITAVKHSEQERERLIEELKNAISKIKTLSGLLPICASCKKIRDDKGYWNQIEGYIQEHSEAEFSHSMCPECSEKFYGKESWYIKMKKKKGIE